MGRIKSQTTRRRGNEIKKNAMLGGGGLDPIDAKRGTVAGEHSAFDGETAQQHFLVDQKAGKSCGVTWSRA